MAKVFSSSQHTKPQLDSIYPQVHFPAIWLIQDLLILNSSKESPGSPQALSESPSIKGYMHCFLCPLSKPYRVKILVFHQLLKCAVSSTGNCLSCLFLLVNPLLFFKRVSKSRCPEQLLQTPIARRVCCSTFLAVPLSRVRLHHSLCRSVSWLCLWELKLVKISAMLYWPHS